MVIVFASNIDNKVKVDLVCMEILKIEGVQHVNVDLDDWENVLRVECGFEIPSTVIYQTVFRMGFSCFELT
ncbi:hypothetical protein J2X69_004118 [Algoriphagus sp. 4150]|nr:hypothetical protein [Algoriphagus sp. 4150]